MPNIDNHVITPNITFVLNIALDLRSRAISRTHVIFCVIKRVNFLANQIAGFSFSGEAILSDIERCFPPILFYSLLVQGGEMMRLFCFG